MHAMLQAACRARFVRSGQWVHRMRGNPLLQLRNPSNPTLSHSKDAREEP
ncbi:protein of unknown function [Paraburkholderia kururiensis]